MNIAVTQVVRNMEDQPFMEAGHEVTFRVVFFGALNSFMPDERPTVDLKAKCWGLMQKLFSDNEVNITSDEAALLKERVGLLYPPLVYGRVCELLDGPAEPPTQPS